MVLNYTALYRMQDPAWYSIIKNVTAWYSLVLQETPWYCKVYAMVLQNTVHYGTENYITVLHGTTRHCKEHHDTVRYTMFLQGTPWHCKVHHGSARYTMVLQVLLVYTCLRGLELCDVGVVALLNLQHTMILTCSILNQLRLLNSLPSSQDYSSTSQFNSSWTL